MKTSRADRPSPSASSIGRWPRWLGLVVLGILTMSCGDVSTPTQPTGPLVQNESPTASPTPAPIPPAVGLDVFTVVVTGLPSAITVGAAVTFVSRVDHAAGPVTYAWEFDDGQPLMTPSAPEITFGRAGLHRVTLTAHDTATSATDAFEITIAPRPAGPAPAPALVPSYGVTLSASPSSVMVSGSATLTATVAANNGALPPASYAWDCDGNNTAEATTTLNTHMCTYSTAGTAMKSRVTVTGGSATGTGTTTVAVVTPPPASYTVTLNASPSSVTVGSSATLTAAVTANNGAVPAASYAWDCDGDNTADTTTASNTHTCTYSTLGAPVTSRVIVTGGSATGTGSTPVTVLAPLFTNSGTGNMVFDLPTTVTKVRISGTYAGTISRFVVRIGGALVVNEAIGTGQFPQKSDGVYLTGGGVVSITNSSGVAWSFTEVR